LLTLEESGIVLEALGSGIKSIIAIVFL